MNIQKIKNRKEKRGQRGFTLLLAALIASIVLALGTSIYDIAEKELVLSSIGQDSQFAFYAADTAAECALYWDFRYGYFASSTPSGVSPACDGQSLLPFTVSPTQTEPYTYPYTMTSQQINIFQDTDTTGGYCVQVYVEKCDGTINADDSCTPSDPPVVHTLIHADGYNVPCNAISTSDQALQRTAEWRY